MKSFIYVILLATSLLLSGCSSGTDKASAEQDKEDSYARGEALFNLTHLDKSLGCIMCHSFSNEEQTVGPNLKGIGQRAGLIVKGQSAEEYLRESIVNPDAHIAVGYEPGTMIADYGTVLASQDIDDLVLFLLEQ